MRVISFISYPPACDRVCCSSWPTGPIYLVRGLKGLAARRSAKQRLGCCCPLGLKTRREALDWFGCLGALFLEAGKFEQPLQLLPIPGSDCTVSESKPPSTLVLAEAVRRTARIATGISDCLRWTRPRVPSHLGGTRDSARLLRDLVLVGRPSGGRVVLIDDVVTTGAHLAAAAARLQTEGYDCHEAICVARTERVGGAILSIKSARVNFVSLSPQKR
jgi:hypothetical protein